MSGVDWLSVFLPEKPLIELLARGATMYLALLVFLRVMPRRTAGELATMDLVFVVLIAEAAARAFGDYTAVADGLVVIASMMACNFVLNALSYHSRLAQRLVSAPPLQVIRDGVLLRRNMRREFLTEEELRDQLRRLGIEDPASVKAAYVEAEGKITAIER